MDHVVIKTVSEAGGIKALEGFLRQFPPGDMEYILWAMRPVKFDLQGFAYRCDELGRRVPPPPRYPDASNI